MGVMLLAAGERLKCLLAAVCDLPWKREIREGTAKRLLQQSRQKVTRGRVPVEAGSVEKQMQKSLRRISHRVQMAPG